MKRIAISSILAILVALPSGAAQLYRWVDEKGNVEWRDTPPPAGAKKVEQRSVGGGAPPTAGLPYSVQMAIKNYPVTLWITNCGPTCDQAKAHLARRGVPYTEKDPQGDLDAFQKLTGDTEVPVLYVGKTQVKGYLDSQYDSALDAAGYPRTPPPGYKPAAKPPAAKPADAAKPSPAPPAAKPGAAQSGPPVKLYTFPECGAPCDAAKALLAGRGIPFDEAVVGVNTSANELQRVSGDLRVPVLVIGESIERAFQEDTYHKALDAAGYAR
jgi:glutaredoxin